MKRNLILSLVAVPLVLAGSLVQAGPQERVPQWVHNLLLDAKLSGNLRSYKQGVRGAPEDMIYDTQQSHFAKSSEWHEYGVGYGHDIGVVPESKPAWWMAEWKSPVEANCITLSGCFANQPQPNTAWKIELRQKGQWQVHAQGVGQWYDGGRYLWGGIGKEPIQFDALRVSLFSKDKQTPLKSILLRGEEAVSCVVADCPPLDVRLRASRRRLPMGQTTKFTAEPIFGDVRTWRWDFGDGQHATGRQVSHAYAKPGTYEVALVFAGGKHQGRLTTTVKVGPPVAARITPLTGPVVCGKGVTFDSGTSLGDIAEYRWDFGDGTTATTSRSVHEYKNPGIYKVSLTVADGTYSDTGFALVRAHNADTIDVPQVLLDTDQKNEQDDQHYLGYAVFSELDVLGVNSVHHGGGQEPINYAEILFVLDLAKKSGAPEDRIPMVLHGANPRLTVPQSGEWFDTEPIVTEASEAILAAARGASPTNPVWVVPVGPGTNVASAILMARERGLQLEGRIRVMWLGGSNQGITHEFNGGNDPWSMYVVGQSGLETWIMPAPVGARVAIDKRSEGDLYADNPLGRYLKKIVPAQNKALFDPACLAAIISMRLKLGWVKEVELVNVGGPDVDYRWTKTDGPSSVRVIRQIDQSAMKMDIFNTMKGQRQRLLGVGHKE
jgi:chitodextrinase/inosine-uridine nucleoside N-ribohydrolase